MREARDIPIVLLRTCPRCCGLFVFGAEFDCNPVLKNFISSVDEINHAQQSTAYPNPVNGGIVFFGKTVVSAGLFDQNGRLIQWEVDSDHMNVESVPTGIYFLKTEGLVQKILITQ